MPNSSKPRHGSVTTLTSGMQFTQNSSGKTVSNTKANQQRMVGDKGIEILKRPPVNYVKPEDKKFWER